MKVHIKIYIIEFGVRWEGDSQSILEINFKHYFKFWLTESDEWDKKEKKMVRSNFYKANRYKSIVINRKNKPNKRSSKKEGWKGGREGDVAFPDRQHFQSQVFYEGTF